MALSIISILLVFLLGLIGVLLFLSPGRMQPFVDKNGEPLAGSISEKAFVSINGVKQGMIIQSKDVTHPVLLYLHGGMPEYFLNLKYPTGLEDIFTVVWWEQRGSGMSYSADIPRESLDPEQMISDTLVLTDYLRNRFHQDRIYLLGHSGATFIAMQAAARSPEKYHAYIGVAQMAHQFKSEKLAYDYMLQQFSENGNTEMFRKLKAAPVTMDGGIPDNYLALRDPAMHTPGIGTMHNMHSVVTGIVLPTFASPQYTLTEKINTWIGKARSGVSPLWNSQISTDLSVTLPELTIPVYFLEGKYDYTCTYSVAKEYFEALRTPLKGFYTFEHSAHCPMFEEPEKFRQIMREDVLRGTKVLADAE